MNSIFRGLSILAVANVGRP